jgi:hypothetical protein
LTEIVWFELVALDNVAEAQLAQVTVETGTTI